MDGISANRRKDMLLRLIGMTLIGVATAALYQLFHLRAAHPEAGIGVASFLLAAVGFVCAGIGSGLVILGIHIGDRVVIAERWRSATARQSPNPRPASTSDPA